MNSEEQSRPKGQKIQKPARKAGKGELELNYCWWVRLDPGTPPCTCPAGWQLQSSRLRAPRRHPGASHIAACLSFSGAAKSSPFPEWRFCNVGSFSFSSRPLFLRWLPPSIDLWLFFILFLFSCFYETHEAHFTNSRTSDTQSAVACPMRSELGEMRVWS